MLGYFPKYYTDKAMLVYFALLICVPIIFGYPMEWYFWIFGIVEVVVFFYFANKLPQKWSCYSSKIFIKELFKTAFVIRFVYVVFSYCFYYLMTGTPFEFNAADVGFYDAAGQLGHIRISENNYIRFIEELVEQGIKISDSGYPIYLSFIYWIFDDSILITRIIKSLWSAFTCVLVYKLASRSFGESIGRMAAIFCMLMPNFTYYCGIHLKETEMVFLIVLFVERADYAIRSKQFNWKALITALLVACLIFMFRTALAAVALIALAVTLMLSTNKLLSLGKKLAIGTIVFITMFAIVGNQIIEESKELINKADSDRQLKNMEWRAERDGGNQFAKYAGAAVFAPMIFTIPFPTMVNIPEQQDQRMIHGGNYIKNITSSLTIFALITLLISGSWRRYVLIISVCCGYLVVMALSEFAQSERFHLPALPFSLIFAAYGISLLQNKHKKWYNYWLILIFVANIAWAWFKLRGRGM